MRSTAAIDFSKLRAPTYLGPRIQRYLGDSWCMHLPFAYDLMREFAPKVFVELGVKQGESYFCFCQSAADNQIAVRCFGVDTWKGDVQTGALAPKVRHEVAEYNWRYSSFSELKPMLFAEALGHFPDASIDLLHIDGTHTYEQVKTDFESWLPKVSAGGIILLHDVIVRDHGFGVWKLWEEIAREDNSFLFEFGSGLAVWKKQPIGSEDSTFVRRLLTASKIERREIHEYYANAAAALALWKGSQKAAAVGNYGAENSWNPGESAESPRDLNIEKLLDAKWEALSLRGALAREKDSIETPAARFLELQSRIETIAREREQLREMLLSVQNDLEQQQLKEAEQKELRAEEQPKPMRESIPGKFFLRVGRSKKGSAQPEAE